MPFGSQSSTKKGGGGLVSPLIMHVELTDGLPSTSSKKYNCRQNGEKKTMNKKSIMKFIIMENVVYL